MELFESPGNRFIDRCMRGATSHPEMTGKGIPDQLKGHIKKYCQPGKHRTTKIFKTDPEVVHEGQVFIVDIQA